MPTTSEERRESERKIIRQGGVETDAPDWLDRARAGEVAVVVAHKDFRVFVDGPAGPLIYEVGEAIPPEHVDSYFSFPNRFIAVDEHGERVDNPRYDPEQVDTERVLREWRERHGITVETTVSYGCGQCSQSFDDLGDRADHMERAHGVETGFQSGDSESPSVDADADHDASTGHDGATFDCPEPGCAAGPFGTQNALNSHVGQAHRADPDDAPENDEPEPENDAPDPEPDDADHDRDGLRGDNDNADRDGAGSDMGM